MADTALPVLPGNTFNDNIGKTKFHKSQFFEKIKGIPMQTDKEKPGIGGFPLDCVKFYDRYPSVYVKGESTLLPAWLIYNKQVLCFDAYFQETAQERNNYAHHVRKCKIYFFLEDGTVQVTEPRIRNSGMPQGCLISRKRIPFPAPRNHDFYDILDFNVGVSVELYGRIFKITDCDKFTRTFLNRIGISVPDPIPMPKDPYLELKAKESDIMAARKPNRYVDTRGQFLQFDRHVLRFCGYWDNREQPYGILRHLAVHYFLADDTIEIREIIPPNSGREIKPVLLSRCKLPKYSTDLPGPGSSSLYSVLNVMPTGFLSGRFIADPLNCGQQKTEYYTDKDFAIGASINCFGRKIVLTDCDPFTKEYYRQKYGIEDFTPAPKPYEPPECVPYELPELPPYNGYGTYEDSAGNCRKVIPDRPKIDFVKFFEKDKQGMNSHVLRFQAKLISNIPENTDRIFIVSFYLSDDTMTVAERVCPNSGFQGGMFFRRMKMYKPGQEIFASKEPDCYKLEDMYIGNTLHLNDHTFILVDADEYALKYLENHGTEFAKNDVNRTMDKIREYICQCPRYKDILRKYLEERGEKDLKVVSYCDMRKILKEVFGDQISEQELITIARKYNACGKTSQIDKETLRSIVHTELKRFLFYDLERLHEGFCEMDRLRTGFVNRGRAYSLLRAAHVPLDKVVINTILDVMPHNEEYYISYPDLVQFLDYKKFPSFHSIPVNQKILFGVLDDISQSAVNFVNLERILQDLNVEGIVQKECT